jgi:Mn-dependent DtxR family transcriptional regulator
MKEAIGLAAGKIWQALSKKDTATISQIPKMIDEKDSLAFQALGWLAREGKVEYQSQGNKTFVRIVK